MENDIIELVGLKEALKILFNLQKASAGITVGPVQFRGELLTQVLEGKGLQFSHHVLHGGGGVTGFG